VDEYTKIDFYDLLTRGVTEGMINRAGYAVHGYDHATIFDDRIIMPWYYSETQPSLMSTKRIGIVSNRKTTHWLICGIDDFPGKSWVHDQLAKRLIAEAHLNDPCLRGLSEVTRLMYQKIGADIRGPEAVALIEGPLGVTIYRAPHWRESNDDTGEVTTLKNLYILLSAVVPDRIVSHAFSQIKAYVDTWKEIYGTEPELTTFTKTVPAGTKLYVVVGNDKGAVDFRFNHCEAVDRDTLTPSVYTKSILKDFK
jgi:hypothetical protein